jgi:tyrosinase
MHIWTGGMNPDSSTPPPEDRNKAVKVVGRRFHSREDMYSQPPFGDMFSNLTTSYDPIFWPLHSNVDRLWWEWQQRHPNSFPVELDAVLTPWSYTIRDTLDMPRFGYEYVKATSVVPVGASAPVGRFVSQPIDIPEPVRQSFGRAEVRLHRVPQLPRSCFIRVFLNLCRMPTPARRSITPTTRGMPPCSATANVMAGRGTARCRRGRASTTCGRAITTRRATTAST